MAFLDEPQELRRHCFGLKRGLVCLASLRIPDVRLRSLRERLLFRVDRLDFETGGLRHGFRTVLGFDYPPPIFGVGRIRADSLVTELTLLVKSNLILAALPL